MDKIQAIEKLVKSLGENSVKEYEEHSNSIIEKVLSLLSDCSDNSQIVIASERCQLDDAISKKSTDGMWELCQGLIHNNNGAWSAMSDNCAEAENDIQNLIDEEEMNNA